MLTEHTHDNELIINGSPNELLDVRLNIGQPVSHPLNGLTYNYKNSDQLILADNIAAPGFKCLLLQNRAKFMFDRLNIKNIQYFDLELIDEKSTVTHCHLANILGNYDIIDYEKSNLDMDDDQIDFIDSLSFIDTSNIKLPPIFRLSNFLPIIVVNDDIKDAFIKHNITGFTFYKPEDFSL